VVLSFKFALGIVAVLAAVDGGIKAVKPDKSKVGIVTDFCQILICLMVKISIVFTGYQPEL
jgi:hypothetical protein